MPVTIGYARQVEGEPSDDVRQEAALRAAGCEAVFVEAVDGEGDVAERTAWKAAIERMQDGDTLVIGRLDHLGRSWAELVGSVEDVAGKGANFVSLGEGIDTRAAGGDVVFTVFGALASFGHSLTVVRARGRNGGRKPLAPEKVAELKRLARDASISPGAICKALGISRASYYRYLGR